MFAGQMKLKTFLLFAFAGGMAFAGGVTGWVLTRPEPPPEPVAVVAPEPVAPPAPVAAAMPVPAAEAAAAPDVGPAASEPWFADVLGFRGKDLGTDKLKDATKGKSWKVNVYQDAGSATANRAKVDLDRDDKWDEKWTFEAGKVTRQVAPADDEAYSATWTWTGGDWVKE